MIIDSHVHVWGSRDWLPEWSWNMLNSLQASRFGRTLEEMARYREKSLDPNGDSMVKNMHRVGVDKAMICVVDYGLVIDGEDSRLPIEEINYQHYEIVKSHPDKFYLAVGVDPRRPNALEIIETGVKEWGAKALKLYPAAGWYPNDTIVYPLYEKCVELGIPVNFHTGPMASPFRSKYTHPIHFDDVAVDFPELTLYCTHAGHGSFMEMIAIARSKFNIVCDLSGWLSWIRSGESLSFYKSWRYMMNMLGSNRLMFASDTTNLIDDIEYAAWVKAVTSIPEDIKKEGITFSDSEMEDFFSKTSKRVLNLEENL